MNKSLHTSRDHLEVLLYYLPRELSRASEMHLTTEENLNKFPFARLTHWELCRVQMKVSLPLEVSSSFLKGFSQ